eukprot:gi/632974837/ref/XP_007903897.1/ PREDICTED: caspase-7 [Callorhinchus milii]
MEDTDKASVTAATEEDVHAIGDTVDAMPDRAGRISFFGKKKTKDHEQGREVDVSDPCIRVVTPMFLYNMNFKKLGKCMIINNKNFDAKTGTVPLYYFTTESNI